jgi:signal transduction histidine kinase
MEKSHLIGEFTDFFNPDRELTWFKVLSTVNSVLLMFESNITNDGINIHRSINVNCELFGIEREFKQMILNIVKNAIDQLTDSGVASPYIAISVTRSEEASAIIVEIRDNAGGIPDEVLPRIFDAYVSTKSLNGAGLGLYMVKIIVLEHFGGTVQAYNSEVGAVFRICIPQNID